MIIFYCLFWIIVLLTISSSEDPCVITQGGYQLAGTCKSLQDCPSAISDLRSGVSVDLQSCQRQDKVLKMRRTCCPTEERISAKKCKEFQTILRNDEEIRPIPFLPLEFQTQRSTSQVHCKKLPTKLIMGGRDANQEEFPHQAALGFGILKDQKWLCGGVLISPDTVMTAAHCVNPTSLGPVQRVLLGTVRLSLEVDNGQKIVPVKQIIPHPLYKKSSVYNDIALLKLKTKVKLSRSILPACLPNPKDRLENLNQTQVTGWGLVENGGSQSDILQIVHLTRLPQKTCEDTYNKKPDKKLRYPDGILRSQFCAGDLGNTNKDSCNGDSGGPATLSTDHCTYYVIGLVSFGSVFCGIEPGVYTNVQSYLDWIEHTIWPTELDK